MNAKFSSRLVAFLIDLTIVFLLFFCLNLLIPENKNVSVLNDELTSLRSDYLKHSIDMSVYINRYSIIQHSLDKSSIPSNLLNAIILLGYFVLLPYYWDGKTIGKRIFKIRIMKKDAKEKITMNDYLVRAIIISGMTCFLASMTIVFIMDDFRYFLITTICGIIQFLLVIISGFMVIYRHDKRGIHDLASDTQVIKER